jgi:WD40 repeat protein
MDTGELNDQAKRVVRRTRAEGEPCLVPDTVVSRIPVGKSGCNAIQFSNDGRFIAAACQNGQSQHVVRVFEVENGKATSWGAELTGHHAVIYSLAWSREDDMLASASSDGSVIVWPVPKRINDDDDDTKMNSPRESEKRTLGVRRRTILTHLPPSYVYCVGFHPTADPPILCTGAYDAQIRLWDVADRGETTKGKDRHSESASALASRLSGNVDSTTLSTREIGSLGRGVALHSSRINVLVFDRRGIRLFTGDGAGVVNVWRCNGDPAETASYRVIKRIEHPDVNGHPISSISVSDVTNTLLVHAKQSIIRMIELKYYRSPHPGFTGAHCGSDIVQSCFSADGRYVLSGSRTGGAHVWKSATGVAVFPAPIRGHRFGQTLSCVAWHPNQHLCALTSRGDGCPILLMEADRDKVNPDEALEASEIMKKRLETMEMDPDELALMDESELTTEQLKGMLNFVVTAIYCSFLREAYLKFIMFFHCYNFYQC